MDSTLMRLNVSLGAKHPGEAESDAADLVDYLTMLGNKEAPARFKAGEAFSTIAFGTTAWPCDFAADLSADTDLIKGVGSQGRKAVTLHRKAIYEEMHPRNEAGGQSARG